MVKLELPALNAYIGEMKYIGPHLSNALMDYRISTCEEMVDVLYAIYDEMRNEPPKEIKKYVKEMLEEMVKNRRPRECCYSSSADERYEAREANKKGFNAIIKLWRHNIENDDVKKCIPASKRERKRRTVFSKRCNPGN